MSSRSRITIQVHPVPGSRAKYVATLPAELLDATFAVVFPETITGAVALHTFAEMIRKQYDVAVDIIVPDGMPLQEDSPVRDVLTQLQHPMFVHEDP